MELGTPRVEFDHIYEEHADAIFRHLYYRLQDRDRALDLTQEVFGRLWQYLASGKKVAYPKAFLYRSAKNAFVNEIRGKKRNLSLDALADEGFDMKHEKEDVETLAVQREAVRRLSGIDPRYREVLVMRYVEEMAVKEIAEVLGESENNISVRIRRGLKKLKETYGE